MTWELKQKCVSGSGDCRADQSRAGLSASFISCILHQDIIKANEIIINALKNLNYFVSYEHKFYA